MIAKHHRILDPQQVHGAAADGGAGRRRHLGDAAQQHRRGPRPVGRAGDRHHRLPRPGPAGGRGPGHLPADDRDDGHRPHQGRARDQHVRDVDDLHHLRRGDGPVLGPEPGAGIPELRQGPAAGRRRAQARPRRDRRRLGLPVRALPRLLLPRPSAGDLARRGERQVVRRPGRRPDRPPRDAREGPRLRQARRLPAHRQAAGLLEPGPRHAAQPSGLVPALPTHGRAGVAEVASHRRVRQGVSGRPQARAAARLQPAGQRHHDGRPAVEQRRRRVGRRDERERVHGPQPRATCTA